MSSGTFPEVCRQGGLHPGDKVAIMAPNDSKTFSHSCFCFHKVGPVTHGSSATRADEVWAEAKTLETKAEADESCLGLSRGATLWDLSVLFSEGPCLESTAGRTGSLETCS